MEGPRPTPRAALKLAMKAAVPEVASAVVQLAEAVSMSVAADLLRTADGALLTEQLEEFQRECWEVEAVREAARRGAAAQRRREGAERLRRQKPGAGERREREQRQKAAAEAAARTARDAALQAALDRAASLDLEEEQRFGVVGRRSAPARQLEPEPEPEPAECSVQEWQGVAAALERASASPEGRSAGTPGRRPPCQDSVAVRGVAAGVAEGAPSHRVSESPPLAAKTPTRGQHRGRKGGAKSAGAGGGKGRGAGGGRGAGRRRGGKKTTPLPGSGTYRLIEGSEVQELAAAQRRAAKADPGLAVRNQAQPRLLCSSAAAAGSARDHKQALERIADIRSAEYSTMRAERNAEKRKAAMKPKKAGTSAPLVVAMRQLEQGCANIFDTRTKRQPAAGGAL